MNRWREVVRSCKRAWLGPGRIDVSGEMYRVAYEARSAWTEPDHALLKALCRGKSRVFDVGANKGITTLLMASSLAESGVAVAFEPSEDACRIIRDNALLNGFQNRIEVVNALVAERSGRVVDFFWDASSVFASMQDSPVAPETESTIALKKSTLSLDDYVRDGGKAPEFVKIDVEGAERQVLEGMRNVLREARPVVFVETHVLSDRSAGQNAMDLLNLVRPLDYRMIRVKTGQEVVDARAFEGLTVRTYVLLVPLEVEHEGLLDGVDTSALT